MVQCMNTYNSSTAWGYEEECLWGQAHGDAKIEGGGLGEAICSLSSATSV